MWLFFFPHLSKALFPGMHSLKYTHPNLAHRLEKGFQMDLWIHGIVTCGLCFFPVFPNWDLDGTCRGLWYLSSLPVKPWAQAGGEELGLHGTVEMAWVCVCVCTAHGQNAELWRLEMCAEPYTNVLQFWPLFVLVGLLFWGRKQAIMNEQRQW